MSIYFEKEKRNVQYFMACIEVGNMFYHVLTPKVIIPSMTKKRPTKNVNKIIVTKIDIVFTYFITFHVFVLGI